ncbi:acyltransferase [Micromonospora eburnea]|uniref:Surface polysaccharide O-acyltransferase, integral membrane enzyme n=1 Tax=Micromonospora eburnea TaxID=227316 RepID=A0A1C6U3L6_9ACTN|nr:acyltransferase family protein [Micromonospora eburnea]SCL48632.1 Surface polysaccharide O-acyltransferase, integral membrane enzyme [Micromonospora eburnea]
MNTPSPAVLHPAAAEPTLPASPAAPPARQYGLDGLRILAICGVVAIHVVGLYVVKADHRSGGRWWLATAIDIGAIWTVPVFVMISGALLLSPRAHRAGPAVFYRKRFVRILPALVVWHLVYLLVVRVALRGEELDPTKIGTLLIDARVYTALYFLWLIAGLYVITPVLATFLADGGRRRAYVTAAVALGWTMGAFMISGAASLLHAPRPISLGAWTMWWPYVGYFLAGWALHHVRLRGWRLVAVLLGTAVLLAEGVWRWGSKPDLPVVQALFPVSYVGTTVALAAIGVFLVGISLGARLRPSERIGRLIVRLSDASFGVFLVHLLLLALIQWAFPEWPLGKSLTATLLTCVGVIVGSFAVSLGAARVPYLRAIF